MAQVRLGGYPAKQCARLTHNRHAPGTPQPAAPAADVLALREAGRVYERAVIDEIVRCHLDSPPLVLSESGDWAQDQRRTVAAMHAGVAVIVNGRLPEVNGRVGAPDVLLHHRGGYLPVDIKNHRTLNPSSNPANPPSSSLVNVSTLAAPTGFTVRRGWRNTGGRWRDDVMQLAHYTRMLTELGLHPNTGENIAGIIGSDDFTALCGTDLGITWYDLDAETIPTYSATGPQHRRKRSALQRYDHEFGFRITVAETALAGGELVRPYRITDCATCEWFDYCAQVAGPDDASFATETGHLNVREWQYLYAAYGRNNTLSVAELAATDPAALTAGFRQQSVGTRHPAERLAATVRRARMTLAGTDLEPRTSPAVAVPGADIEVDFDIEWDADGRIYQWGLRIRDGQDDATARYDPVVSFAPLDEAAETALAAEFAAKITELRARADRDGKSLQVFHWHHPETSRTRKFAAVERALDGLTVDLMKWFNTAYFARTSSSIKRIAAIFGFGWGVADPGGLASQNAVDIARGSGPEAEAARRWCLRYNEGDVAAQAAIRDGLRRFQPCD